MPTASLRLEAVLDLLSRCRHTLRYLSLRSIDHLLNDHSIAMILQVLSGGGGGGGGGGTKLVKLNLGSHTARAAKSKEVLSNQTLLHIRQYCPLLQHLSLYNQEGVSDDGIASLLSTTTTTTLLPPPPPLSHVDLGFCPSVTDETLARLATACPSLRCLYLKCCWKITSGGLFSLLILQPRLEVLDCSNCR